MRARVAEPKKTILIIEDNSSLAISLKLLLADHFLFDISYTSDPQRACELIDKGNVELLVADWLLEENQTSLEVIKYLNQHYPQTKVLMLTKKNQCSDRVEAYKIGADAYLAKPFERQELLLLVKKLLGSYKLSQPAKIISDEISIYFNLGKIERGKDSVILRPKEIQIFRVLFLNRPNVISKQRLIDLVWPNLDDQPKINTVEVYIRKLRQFLGPLGISIINQRGYGYYLVLDKGKLQ